MPSVRALEVDVNVESGQFYVVFGRGDTEGPVYSGTEEFLVVEGSGLLCISGGSDHTASVRLEVHADAAPDVGDDSWELVRTVRVVVGDGPSYVLPLSGGPILGTLDVGKEGEGMEVRVCCRGRREVRRLLGDPDARGLPMGVEQWLIQAWPSDAA